MTNQTRHYSVKTTTFPSTGERFVLVVGPPDGIAIQATTIYTLMTLRERGCSPNTMRLAMQAVAILLEWALSRLPELNLDERIGSGTLLFREEIHALRRELRLNHSSRQAESPDTFVSAGTYYNRCHAVRDYVTWHSENIIRRIPLRDHERVLEHRRRLEDFRTMIVSDLPASRSRAREGVGEEVQQIFLEAIKPGSSTNPFQASHQARNYALLLLYYTHGIRRSEALKIKGEDLHLVGEKPMVRIMVRMDEAEDPRKVEPRAKTEGRDLFLGPDLCLALREWVTEHRKTYPNAKKTPYVFVARNGRPLSIQAVGDMFRLLRARVPGLPADFSSHLLRHTANDRLSDIADELGRDDAEDKRNRNYQFGWAKNSNQGESYRSRSTRRRAAEASRLLQERSWKGEPA